MDGRVIMLPKTELASDEKYGIIVPSSVLEDHAGNALLRASLKVNI